MLKAYIIVYTILVAQIAMAQAIRWEYVPGLDTTMTIKAIVFQQQYLFVGRKSNVHWVNPGYCGLYRSGDYGQSWQEDTSFSDANIEALHAHQDNYILAGCDRIPHESEYDGIYRTSDLGRTWEMVDRYTSAVAFGDIGRYVFAGHGVQTSRRSIHGAYRWQAGIGYSGNFFFASIDSVILTLNIDFGIGRSLDSGLKWRYKGFTDPPLTLYSKDGFLLMGTVNEGVYRSTDYGLSWHLHNRGMVGYTATGVSCYALHMAENILYAGTSEGLYYSVDKGNLWRKANDSGLNNKAINILNSGGGYLFAGTKNGLYRAKISATGIAELAAPISELSITPNPAAESFTIHCPEGAEVTIRDVLGNDKMMSSGISNGMATFSTIGLASGIYFVEILGTDGTVSLGKVLVNR